jgi:hypothetical protein
MDIHDFYANIHWKNQKDKPMEFMRILQFFCLSLLIFFITFCIIAVFIYGLINHDSNWVNVGITSILVVITAYYTYFTQKLRETSEKQLLSSQNPVIGIKIITYGISSEFGQGRRNLNVNYNLENIGNSSAIEIFVDSEIELPKGTINGQQIIPSRFYPDFIPYLKSGDSLLNPQKNEKDGPYNQSYGNTLINQMLIDYFGENYKTDIPKQGGARLFMWDEDLRKYKANITFHVYYKNSLSQYFESTFKQYIHIWQPTDEPNEYHIESLGLKGQLFNSNPITKEQMENEIVKRDQKRELCGW